MSAFLIETLSIDGNINFHAAFVSFILENRLSLRLIAINGVKLGSSKSLLLAHNASWIG